MSGMERLSVFRELADVLPFGVVIVALDGTILYWNPAAERIRGYRSHEVVGRRCGFDPLSGHCEPLSARCENVRGKPEAAACPHAAVLIEGKALDRRVLVSHCDGHHLPVRMQAIPMHDGRGAMVAVAEIFAEQAGDGGAACWMEKSSVHASHGIPGMAVTEDELRQRLIESPGRLGVFLVEIEALDDAVKRYGAGIRAVALRSLAQTLVSVLSSAYFVGSWTADRFLVIVPECGEESCGAVMDKLHRVGSACVVTWWGDRIRMEVRATGTLADSEDSIGTVMQRLEHAAPAHVAGGER